MAKTSFNAARFSGFMFDPDDLVIIGHDTDDGEEHPLWDERIKLALDEAMVVSIMAIGVKEPILVVKMKIGNKEVAVVVDGRRRVLHAREANKRLKKLGEPLVKVPAKVERGSDEHLSHVAVALNEIRRQDEVLVKANKALRMINRGSTEADVAVAFGVSQMTIKNWMKIVELPAPVKKAVNQGVLSANAASKLHGLERAEQLKQLEKLTEEHKKTGKKVSGTKASASASASGSDSNGKPKKPSKKDLKNVVSILSHETDPFIAGAMAGIRYALGEDIPEVKKAIEKVG